MNEARENIILNKIENEKMQLQEIIKAIETKTGCQVERIEIDRVNCTDPKPTIIMGV